MAAAESVLPRSSTVKETDEDVKKVLANLVSQIDQNEAVSAAGTQTISINTLPDNLLLNLFSRLKKMDDRCSVARTCRRWNRIIKDGTLWKYFRLLLKTVDGFPTVKNVISSGLNHSLLRMNILVSSTSSNFHDKPQFWQAFPNLQFLSMSDIDLSEFDFEILPPSLESLEILLPKQHDERFIFVKDFCLPWEKRVKCSRPVLPNLEDLHIEDRRTKFEPSYRKGDLQEIHGIHHLCSSGKIEYLYILVLHYDFTEDDLSEIAKKVANVRYFCFYSQSSFFKLSKTVLAPLKRVEKLHLKCFKAVDKDTEVAAILSCLSSLKTLEEIVMVVPFDVEEKVKNTLKKALPKLSVLVIQRLQWDPTDPPMPWD